jgi:hypothetical protein
MKNVAKIPITWTVGKSLVWGSTEILSFGDFMGREIQRVYPLDESEINTLKIRIHAIPCKNKKLINAWALNNNTIFSCANRR